MEGFSILNNIKIQHKINRIAHEINEQVYGEETIYLVGIKEHGAELANRLLEVFKTIGIENRFKYVELSINKNEPMSDMPILSIERDILSDQCVILIDDVLNSGKTLMYAANYILHSPIRRLITAVLVERKHRIYPIRADIVGFSLSTTLEEHISINLEKGKETITLS